MLGRAFLPPFALQFLLIGLGLLSLYQESRESIGYVSHSDATALFLGLGLVGFVVTVPIHLAVVALAHKTGINVPKIYGGVCLLALLVWLLALCLPYSLRREDDFFHSSARALAAGQALVAYRNDHSRNFRSDCRNDVASRQR
jgi:hypothetical protein